MQEETSLDIGGLNIKVLWCMSVRNSTATEFSFVKTLVPSITAGGIVT
jgi:hypothetical protein